MADVAKHLARAKDYIGRGEAFYRKAAEEIVAAMKADPTLSYATVGQKLGKGKDYARRLVTSYTNGARARDGEFAVDWGSGDYERPATKRVLRDSTPEEIAEILSEPRVRANVAKAQDIAYRNVERDSRQKQREAIGVATSDRLDEQQRLHDAEAELFKARRGLIETLRILNAVGMGNVPDSWREEFLRTFDDITAKAEIGRALLVGALDEELDKLLEGQS